MRASYIIGTVLPMLALSCDAHAPFVGTWDLEVIDNVPINEAAPDRMDFPEGNYGGTAIAEGEIWSESQALQVTLEIRAEGDFREEVIQRESLALTFEAFYRVTGNVPRGTGPVRMSQGVDTSLVIGQWNVEGDSVFLTRTHEQAEASMTARLQEVLPDLSREEARRHITRILERGDVGDSVWFRGTVSGNRLSAVDWEGRRLVFRRAVP